MADASHGSIVELGVFATPSRVNRFQTFIGRDLESNLLDHALADACLGRGNTILIGGEAGIGKSTLLQHFVDHAVGAGASFRSGRCSNLEAAPPFGPWRELLAEHPDQRTPDTQILNPTGNGEEAEGWPLLRSQVRTLLARGTADAPIVLALEDVHWADQPSLLLARLVATDVHRRYAVFLLTFRDGVIGKKNSFHQFLPMLARETDTVYLELGPLNRQAIASLIDSRYHLSTPDRSRLIEWLIAKTEGNPLFVTEVLTSLEANGVVRQVDNQWLAGDLALEFVPSLLRQFISARLGQLSNETQRLLSIASVIGVIFSLDLWQRAADASIEQISCAAKEACAAGILEESSSTSTLRFRHALHQQSLYESLPIVERRHCHLRVGSLLASSQDVDSTLVAFHLSQAQSETAIPWLIAAGKYAIHFRATAMAIDFFNQAISLAATLDEPAPPVAYLSLGAAYSYGGDFTQAENALYRALTLARAGGPAAIRFEWEAQIRLNILWTQRDYGEAERFLNAAQTLATGIDDPIIKAQTRLAIGNWAMNTGRISQFVTGQHNELQRLEKSGDQSTVAEAANMLAMAHVIEGDMEQAIQWSARASQASREIGDSYQSTHALQFIFAAAGVYEFSSELPARPSLAINIKEAATEIIERSIASGWRSTEAFARSAFGSYLGYHGQVGAGFHQASIAREIAEEIEHWEWLSLANLLLGNLNLDTCQLGDAEHFFRQAYHYALANHSFIQTHLSAAGLGRVLIARSCFEEAKRILPSLNTEKRDCHSAPERLCLAAEAELLLRSGYPESAEQLLQHLINTTANGSSSRIVPHLGFLLAQTQQALGQFTQAINTAELGISTASTHGLASLHWRLLMLKAKLIRKSDNVVAARARSEAESLVRQIAATLVDERRRNVFMQFALDNVSPGQSDRSDEKLSARESEVLQLASLGLTNPQIAERLFISTRTVKGHLQSIYFKLNVNTRTAAVSHAYEHGVLSERIS